MSAFIQNTLPRPVSSHSQPLYTCRASRDEPPSPVSLDTLSNFESFCWRAQDWLCTQTAAADGLGTFQPTPTFYPSTSHHPSGKKRHRIMKGGRAFDTAVISVWRSAEQVKVRKRALTMVDPRTARVEYIKDAAGVSVKLQPHDPTLPALRADAHYFQIGGGNVSWWFAGTADISLGPATSPELFTEIAQPFFQTWEKLRTRHRTTSGHAARAFLDDLFRVDSASDPSTRRLDCLTAYGFITEMVDALLPAYLPLLGTSGHSERAMKRLHDVWDSSPTEGAETFGERHVDKFCIEGGAACESVTVRSSPLGSWRFSLAPSMLTSAGRTYATLRDNRQGWKGPFLHA
eukprot:GFKZ01009591.1.p1 GENE.GFKZ01009591.1~~GFKZ01009591.1.p1  ORF type:complete len:346 (-),score=17.97 GFKZ01009591.1:1104-2141(-)